jgi:hypothetical protein
MDDHQPNNAQGYHPRSHGIRDHGSIMYLDRMSIILRLAILCKPKTFGLRGMPISVTETPVSTDPAKLRRHDGHIYLV